MQPVRESENRSKSSHWNKPTPCVLVFTTNIDQIRDAESVCKCLLGIKGISKSTVDLEDWEKILRVECESESLSEAIADLVNGMGWECKELV